MTVRRVALGCWAGLVLACVACADRRAEGDALSADADHDAEAAEADAERATRLEPLRPEIHFTPLRGWMNDPNGLVFFQGEYHLFHQYAPEGFFTSGMHWGHAVSADLIHWTDLPTALAPDPELGQAYSGSAVVDERDASGLCAGDACLVAAFTHSGGSLGGQKQSLAYSRDRGRAWTLHADNPVLTPEAGQADFRDPKIFWHEETGRWVMALAVKDRVRFYSSADLRDWAPQGEFVKAEGDPTGTWECPDLFPLAVENRPGETTWALIVSVFNGGPQGGSGVRYFTGAFDGARFAPDGDPAAPRWLDVGADFYAWQSWSDAPGGRRAGLAWMNNWRYAAGLGTEPWQGAMTLPREIRAWAEAGGELRLRQTPAAEVDNLRGAERLRLEDEATTGERELWTDDGRAALDMEAVVRPGAAAAWRLTLRSGGRPALALGWEAATETLYVERAAEGLAEAPVEFPGRQETPLALADGALRFRLFLDRSSAEFFVPNGGLAMTAQFFPAPGARALAMSSEGGRAVVESLTLWELRSAW